MNNKVLFVAVHPDDETLGCGGTILKHKSSGDEVYWLIITSIRNHPSNRYSEQDVVKRDKIIQQVSSEYGFDGVEECNFPTTLLDKEDLGLVVGKIGQVLDKIKPEIVYMMFQNDVHSDHRVAFQAVYSCLKSFRRPYVKKIMMFEALSETEFAVATPQTSFIPNVYVDITDYFDEKIKIMELYDTEVMESPYPRSISSLKALARLRGSRAGVLYAEAFMLIYSKE